MEMSKAKSLVIVHGKTAPNVKPQQWHSTNVTRVPHIGSDEFKYGFPSNGLAVFSYKWWGSSNEDTDNNVGVDESEKSNEQEQKSDGGMDHCDEVDGKGPETGNDESNADLRGTGLLSHLRKRAAKEGKEALRLGVYRGFDISRVGKKERKLLLRVFKSSLPSNRKIRPSDS